MILHQGGVDRCRYPTHVEAIRELEALPLTLAIAHQWGFSCCDVAVDLPDMSFYVYSPIPMGGGPRSLALRVEGTWAMSSRAKGSQHPLMSATVSTVCQSSSPPAHKSSVPVLACPPCEPIISDELMVLE